MASLTADTASRHQQVPFDLVEDARVEGSHVIQALLSKAPGVKLYTRSSPRFESLREVYNSLVTTKPLVICRPQTIDQVQSIVKAIAGLDVPLAVRCGGHDVWGRGCIADSVTIDMREMDTQILAEDKQTVTVGGGITSNNFVNFLDTHGLCTANGTAGTVGWTGWALWGGYGPLGDYFGLGVDNILAAKVVTAQGEVIEADDELLWGIRGAGGNFGVIVELKVKVYPLPKITAGFIAYEWSEAVKVFLGLQNLLDRGVPDALGLQAGFLKGEWGLGATLIFLWPDSDAEEGKKWLDIVRGLGTVLVDTVSETTYKDFQDSLSEHHEQQSNVYTRSASIHRFTPTTIAKIVKRIEDIPDTRSYLVVGHIQHGKGTRPNPLSCFGTRQPHVLFHINACDDADRMGEAIAWADGLVADLRSTGETMEQAYVSFMGEDEDTSNCFGDGWERLRTLKKRVDGQNVFRFAQPKLPTV